MAQTIKKHTYTIGVHEIDFSIPSIQRHFWFPEDARTTEEWDEVQSRVSAASKSEEFFITENMNDLYVTRLLKDIDNVGRKLYVYDDKRFVEVVYLDEEPSYHGNHHLLDKDEKEQLRAACKKEQELFMKRLRTYLKRYGLSKCTFSSFWINR